MSVLYLVSDGSVRLVQGRKYTEGYVELFSNGKWKAVCNLWKEASWNVVCLQLGHDELEAVHPTGSVPMYEGSDIGNEVYKCTGSEKRLNNCPFTTRASCQSASHVTCSGMFINDLNFNTSCWNA